MTPEQHIDQVRELAELKTSVKNMAQDVTLLVKQMDIIRDMQIEMSRIQQEQVDHKEAIKRAFTRIESTEKTNIELKETTSKWINRGVGAVSVGTVLISFIQMLIYNRVDNYEKVQTSHGESLVTIDRRMSWAEYEIKEGKKKESK